MMISRRSILIGTASIVSSKALSEEISWQSVLKQAIIDENPVTLGRILPPADSPLWARADGFLKKASEKKRPLDIARYFVDSIPNDFQIAWPEPNPQHPTLANPIIVRFFLATKTKPSGDKTAWCAAFLNWILMNSSPQIDGTGSASSQSFLKWGREVWARGEAWPPKRAQQGDVLVFRQKTDPAHGHVSFFDGSTPKQILRTQSLGGNQFNTNREHTFSVKSLPINGNLELVSIRTADGLHVA